MTDFESRVLPVVTKFAIKVFRTDDQKWQDAVGNAWFMYNLAGPKALEITASRFAAYAVSWARVNRNLPGVGGTGHLQDALDRPNTWRAGVAMVNLVGPEPRPEEVAQQRELEAILDRETTPRQKQILKLIRRKLKGFEIAAKLGISQPMVSVEIGRIKELVNG